MNERPTTVPALHIASLALALPAGFERRAARIGRLTAEALAAAPPLRTGAIAALRLAPQQIAPHWSDRRIAGVLAAAIRRQIDSPGY
ncbi:hypothetical protein CJ010_10250 [Azoarcus sp. DD4]|uniref:hypothetical protein n=1 Tax=Azoarcus sp. DD4 TaxID=2027405 RepID=UPI0011290FC9|nr:hypothetical protein [Azoarcus sp. DD4]QDF96885.1 hypothetical protein CJ010_10250 [Azoarcus sp. DD4]